MRTSFSAALFLSSTLISGVVLVGCDSASESAVDAAGGSAGSGGSGGASGSAGSAGSGGSSGSAGAGGTSGTAGSGGSAGSAGSGGASGSAGAGGTAGSSGSGGSGGSSGSAGSGGTGGTGGAAGTGGTAGSAGTGGTAGTAGSGGTGGSGGGWPTCDAPEPGAAQKTIHEIWQANPTTPTEVWVSGAYVTAISYGACSAGFPCEIFVQSAEQFADLSSGAQQAIKIFVSANTASHFVGVAVGDKVDIDAFAWRYNVSGQNELLLQVNTQLPGCAKPVGTGAPVPVAAALTDLTVAAYEDTLGPLLIQVNSVSGHPSDNGTIFALWDTATGPSGGVTNATSLTPYYLTGGHFSGLTLPKIHDFTSVTGVFSLFFESSTMTKYKTIGPRKAAEYPIALVHP